MFRIICGILARGMLIACVAIKIMEYYDNKEKKEKKSVINWSVAGSILLVLLIALVASCV